MRLRRGALPARLAADVRALLSLPGLPAADRQCFRDQRADRDRPRLASVRQSGTGRSADAQRPAAGNALGPHRVGSPFGAFTAALTSCASSASAHWDNAAAPSPAGRTHLCPLETPLGRLAQRRPFEAYYNSHKPYSNAAVFRVNTRRPQTRRLPYPSPHPNYNPPSTVTRRQRC